MLDGCFPEIVWLVGIGGDRFGCQLLVVKGGGGLEVLERGGGFFGEGSAKEGKDEGGCQC